MTTATTADIEALYGHLEQQPDDRAARLALADALNEAGDDSCYGHMAIAACGIVVWGGWRPLLIKDGYHARWPFYFWRLSKDYRLPTSLTTEQSEVRSGLDDGYESLAVIAEDWFVAATDGARGLGVSFTTCRKAEDALCRGFLQLSPERQQQLLRGQQ